MGNCIRSSLFNIYLHFFLYCTNCHWRSHLQKS